MRNFLLGFMAFPFLAAAADGLVKGFRYARLGQQIVQATSEMEETQQEVSIPTPQWFATDENVTRGPWPHND